MMMKELSTKDKMIEAASLLFFQKGFDGTSVRDIAGRADVNVSLISYYFKSKQGLLEYAVTNYYESYLETMEETMRESEHESPMTALEDLIHHMLNFRIEHYQLSAFISRELLMDSTFVREMAVTYLAKENHFLSRLFYQILPDEKKQQKRFFYMQLKGMIMSPFNLKIEWDTTLLDQVSREHFVAQYMKTVTEWMEHLQSK